MQIPKGLIESKPIMVTGVKPSGRAYVYVRVSTKEQAADGTSLTTQTQECVSRLEGMGLKLGPGSNYGYPGVFCDPGVSAWKCSVWQRPGFLAMWKILEPGDTIVILSLDRMFRSLQDFTRSWHVFEKSGVALVSIVGKIDMRTAMGRLMSHIFGAFAEFKSNLISQRVREGQAARKQRLLEGGEEKTKKQKLKPIKQDWLRDLDEDRPTSLFELTEQTRKKGKVYGYVRVSRLEQDVDSQIKPVEQIMTRLAKDGYDDSGCIYEDHASAFKTNWSERPFGELLWNEVEEGDVIVVARVDRAFRSLRDMIEQMTVMTDMGVHLVTGCGVDTRDPTSRNMLEILAMMAEWESRDHSWRMKLAHRYARMEYGKWGYTGPQGVPSFLRATRAEAGHYRIGVNWEYIDEVKEVWELVESGMKYQAIADEMARRASIKHNMIPIPVCRFDPVKFFRGNQYHKKFPREQVENFKEWCKGQYVDNRGEIGRTWSKVSISRVCNQFRKPIERICELGYWGTVEVMNKEEGISLMKVG